ncbi:MAG TPA: ABC1 kinase family protein [Desulfobacterales bacterium]
MKLSQGVQQVGNIARFASIARVLAKHGLGDLFERLFRRQPGPPDAGRSQPLVTSKVYPSPVRMRRVLEELGPSFIKLGQLMSTRADVFPEAYIQEFKRLQDRVPPIAFAEIRKVIESELKKPLTEVFASIEENCLAAASVAQVHLARLHSGESVVVKVIRPSIEKKIREDIRLMYYFAAKIESTFDIGRVIGAVNLVKEFERTIFRELDMLVEAGNIERFAANFADSEELYIPKVYWDVTSRSVLVMEHIEGIKMDRVSEIVAHGIDPKEIAMIGLRAFSRQLMEFGLFHADPHPGNTIVMYDGRVSLVDFGIIGYLDEETMQQIANIFLGYAEHDYDLILEALEDAGLVREEGVDLKQFRAELKDLSEPFYGRSLQNVSVREVYDRVMTLSLKYGIRLPRNLLLLLKTFIQTEALGKILGSDASLLEVTRPYARTLLERGYDARKLLRNFGKDSRQTAIYAKALPKLFHNLLQSVATGKHRIEMRHSFQQMDTKLEKGINRLTVGIIVSASVIAGALILNSSQRVLEFTVRFFGVHTVSITALLGISGYVLATVLGLWLVLSIFRSGKM